MGAISVYEWIPHKFDMKIQDMLYKVEENVFKPRTFTIRSGSTGTILVREYSIDTLANILSNGNVLINGIPTTEWMIMSAADDVDDVLPNIDGLL